MTLQSIAAAISFVGILVMVAIYAFVLSRSSEAEPYEEVQARAYRLRAQFFYVLLAGFFLVPAFTLRALPYNVDASAETTTIEVSAHQWYWLLSQSEVRAGDPVIFRVESKDVNHGFALYDKSNRLITQVQAMPGYVNELAHTFEEPGTYRIMCLEYCGMVHHGMIAAITVVPEATTLGAL